MHLDDRVGCILLNKLFFLLCQHVCETLHLFIDVCAWHQLEALLDLVVGLHLVLKVLGALSLLLELLVKLSDVAPLIIDDLIFAPNINQDRQLSLPSLHSYVLLHEGVVDRLVLINASLLFCSLNLILVPEGSNLGISVLFLLFLLGCSSRDDIRVTSRSVDWGFTGGSGSRRLRNL